MKLQASARVSVLSSKIEHCALLAEAMDGSARELIRKGWGVEPREGLEAAFRASPLCWTIIEEEGQVLGMFGCADGADCGCPWLTTAPGIEKYRLRFIRQSRSYIAQMLDRHKTLISWAHHENKALLAWLKWGGFRIEEGGEVMKCVYHR